VDNWSSVSGSISTIALFRKSLYVYLLLETLVFFIIGSSLWGSGALIAPVDYSNGWFGSMHYLLVQEGIADYYWLFLVVRVVALGTGLLGIFPCCINDFYEYVTSPMS